MHFFWTYRMSGERFVSRIFRTNLSCNRVASLKGTRNYLLQALLKLRLTHQFHYSPRSFRTKNERDFYDRLYIKGIKSFLFPLQLPGTKCKGIFVKHAIPAAIRCFTSLNNFWNSIQSSFCVVGSRARGCFVSRE